MKKFYAIGLLALSTIFSLSATAQCPVNTTAVNYGLTSGCLVTLTTSNAYIGGQIRVFAGNEDVTIGDPRVTPSTRFPGNGGGAAPYPCERFEDITRVAVISPGTGPTCFAEISNNINLPIKLSSFTVSLKGSSAVQLNWSTSFEAN
ncbi:MAG: hypothetical protein EOO02_22590, partial [Chitinophagaceae bacterium]